MVASLKVNDATVEEMRRIFIKASERKEQALREALEAGAKNGQRCKTMEGASRREGRPLGPKGEDKNKMEGSPPRPRLTKDDLEQKKIIRKKDGAGEKRTPTPPNEWESQDWSAASRSPKALAPQPRKSNVKEKKDPTKGG